MYFELSKDLGFRVICSANTCSIKILHHSYFKHSVKKELWDDTEDTFAPFDQSLDVKVIPKAHVNVSKLIVSGKYKRANLAEILQEKPHFTQTTSNTGLHWKLKGSLKSLTHEDNAQIPRFSSIDHDFAKNMLTKPQSPPATLVRRSGEPTRTKNLELETAQMVGLVPIVEQFENPTNKAGLRDDSLGERGDFVPLRNFFDHTDNKKIAQEDDKAYNQEENKMKKKQQVDSFDQKKNKDHVDNNSFLDSSFGDEMKNSGAGRLNTSKSKDEIIHRKDMEETIENIYQMMDRINEQA